MNRRRTPTTPAELRRVLDQIADLSSSLKQEVREMHDLCYGKRPGPAIYGKSSQTSDPTGEQATGNLDIKHHYNRAAQAMIAARTELWRAENAFRLAVKAADYHEDLRNPRTEGDYGRRMAPPQVTPKELRELQLRQMRRKGA